MSWGRGCGVGSSCEEEHGISEFGEDFGWLQGAVGGRGRRSMAEGSRGSSTTSVKGRLGIDISGWEGTVSAVASVNGCVGSRWSSWWLGSSYLGGGEGCVGAQPGSRARESEGV